MAAASGTAPAQTRPAAPARGLREWTGPVLVALCALAFLWELHAPVPQVDDAYISYRYARNLVEGHGLVYNTGERVEGYTNLLWTLGVAGGLALGAPARETAHALGLASGIAVLLATFALAAAGMGRRGRALAGLAPWLVLASTPFARWATAGLETPLFAATVTAAFAAQARGRIGWATAAAIAATLTRPEGALLAAILLGSDLTLRRRECLREPLRVLRPVAAYALALAALTAFRLAYYGSPVPNTFYAKVGDVSRFWGVLYALTFLGGGAFWMLPPALFALVGTRRTWPAAAWVVASLAYVVWIGGDALGHGRLLVPALPCLAALATRGVAVGLARGPRLAVPLAACLALATVWQVFGRVPTSAASLRHPLRARALHEVRRFDAGFEEVGFGKARVLQQRGETDVLVATGAIGSFGYHSRVRILDILGLVDPVIAHSEPDPDLPRPRMPGHQRSNADYVFSREPDYILIARKGSEGKGNLPAVYGLWAHPELERSYEWDEGIWAYRRRAEPLKSD